jgi:hypothetical protein
MINLINEIHMYWFLNSSNQIYPIHDVFINSTKTIEWNGTPTNQNDLTNKKYVDDSINDLQTQISNIEIPTQYWTIVSGNLTVANYNIMIDFNHMISQQRTPVNQYELINKKYVDGIKTDLQTQINNIETPTQYWTLNTATLTAVNYNIMVDSSRTLFI